MCHPCVKDPGILTVPEHWPFTQYSLLSEGLVLSGRSHDKREILPLTVTSSITDETIGIKNSTMLLLFENTVRDDRYIVLVPHMRTVKFGDSDPSTNNNLLMDSTGLTMLRSSMGIYGGTYIHGYNVSRQTILYQDLYTCTV